MSESKATWEMEGDAKDESLEKPSHVRRLNFGQSILTLDVERQFQGQKTDGTLVTDLAVANIPCTKKGEFVRKWLETHGDRVPDSDESSQTSPVLGSFIPKRIENSPVFGNSRKRPREKSSRNICAVDNTEHECSYDTHAGVHEATSTFSTEDRKRAKVNASNRKENFRRNLFNSPTTISSKASTGMASPILDRRSCFYKRRRRRIREKDSGRKVLERIDNRRTEAAAKPSPGFPNLPNANESPILDGNYFHKRRRRKPKAHSRQTIFAEAEKRSHVDANMNSVIFDDASDKKYQIMLSQEQHMLLKKLENSLEQSILESTTSKESKILEDCVESDSPVSKAVCDIDDSSGDVRDTEKIVESSQEGDDNYKNLIVSTDSDKTLSDQIEDVDTQDVVKVVVKNPNYTYATSISSSAYTQRSAIDSDKTYCSMAERLLRMDPSTSSQKISQMSSQVKTFMDTRSSQTRITISTETSPQRPNPDPSMFLNLLDSGKKRKKPKKGSLCGKLQSMINSQISSVRMWRHQLKQAAKENTSLPCVTVYTRSCTTRFSRQFLEGTPIEDPFNLLPANWENTSSRSLTIMTIPDIVGRLEMKSESIVQIFPPWETLDDKQLTLHVTYINIVSDNEKLAAERSKLRTEETKQSIVQEFDCPCTSTDTVVSSCKDRFNKPNVMEKLYTE